jgi:hypothetical protein
MEARASPNILKALELFLKIGHINVMIAVAATLSMTIVGDLDR